MGAWGINVFQDDAAVEWIEKILESDDPEELFESIFLFALDTHYVEYSESNGVTVSAGIIDMLANNTLYIIDEKDLPIWGEVLEWVEENKDEFALKKIAKLGAQALEIITSKKSELNELWETNTAEYATWKMKLDKLAKRLKKVKN